MRILARRIGMMFVLFASGLLAQDADVMETQSTASGVSVTTTTSSKQRVIRAPSTSLPTSVPTTLPTTPGKASKPFTPSERIQFDSAVAFPTDI